MKHEYHEGLEAAERFEQMAKKIFRASKSSAKPVPKKQSVRKAKNSSRVVPGVPSIRAFASRDGRERRP